MKKLSISVFMLALAGCATTDIQPMSRDTFKVATNAAPACGPSGARNVAYKAAAIEVIRRGGDKFIIAGDHSDMGVQGDVFTGFQTNFAQGMVVRLIPENSPEAPNALSARETLGADWQTVYAEGVPNTCS